MAQRGQRRPVEIANPVDAEELAHADQQRCLGSAEDVGGLARGVAGVQGYHDGARVVGGKARDHPVPRVRRPDRHPVARVDAKVDHRRGNPPDLGLQLGERQLAVVGDECGAVGEFVGDPIEDPRNGPRLARH